MSREKEEKKTVPSRDQRVRMDLVLKYFVEGMSIPNIVQQLKDHHGIEVARDVPYQDISRATARRWLKYDAPREQELSEGLKSRYKGLLEAFVPSRGEHTTVMEAGAHLCAGAIYNIAKAKALGLARGSKEGDREQRKPWGFPIRLPGEDGAEVIRDLAQLDKEERKRKDLEPLPLRVEVRIGFSGGNTMSLTAHDLGHVIADQIEEWEKKLKDGILEFLKKEKRKEFALLEGIIKRRFNVDMQLVFVNLVSGFDPESHTNPIAFLTAFLNDEVLAPRTTVKIFNAMPFVEIGKGRDIINEIEVLRNVRHYYDEKGFDIILTSGSSISDRHGTFRRYYEDKRLTELLIENGVQGDYFWLPLTSTEPFSLRDLKKGLSDDIAELLKYRPMTLLTLEDLAEHVEAGRDVFFILAPCAKCYEEKSQVAKAVLGQRRPIATHLVVDRTSAEKILGKDK